MNEINAHTRRASQKFGSGDGLLFDIGGPRRGPGFGMAAQWVSGESFERSAIYQLLVLRMDAEYRPGAESSHRFHDIEEKASSTAGIRPGMPHM